MDSEYLIPIGEAAIRLGVSIDTLRRWDKSGKLTAIRKNGIRYYSEKEIDVFLNELSAMAFDWASAKIAVKIPQMFYCQDSSIFQVRLMRMQNEFTKALIPDNILFLLSSIAGEIGNNSFDHNLGNWIDVPGVFFGYDINKREIVLADRGQGLLKTLQRVKANLANHRDALNVAFTESISGRSPENRGNGLKYVRISVLNNPIDLFYQSGDHELEITRQSHTMEIKKSKHFVRGCIAVIKF